MAVNLLLRGIDNPVRADVHSGHAWRTGELVCIKPSPWVWGTDETPPNFWVVELEGVNEGDPRLDLLLELGREDPISLVGERISRRRRYLDANNLSAALRNALQTSGTIQVRANQVAGVLSAFSER